jgi:hypothetical protein
MCETIQARYACKCRDVDFDRVYWCSHYKNGFCPAQTKLTPGKPSKNLCPQHEKEYEDDKRAIIDRVKKFFGKKL